MAGELPQLVRAGGSYVTVKWRSSAEGLEAEYRRTAWVLPGPYKACELPPGSVYCTSEDGEEVVHVTLSGLEPQTVYDVRLSAASGGGPRRLSRAATFSTLTLVPKLSSAPEVRCARHDRLLLSWAGPVSDSGDVLAYKVRYFDCEPRWPVRREIEVKLASRLLRRSAQMQQFLNGDVAIRCAAPPHGHHHGIHHHHHHHHASSGTMANSGSGGSDAAESEPEEPDGAEVHFWLLSLVPARMYFVQVAAITAAGTGEWSPKSAPLYTWRVAPVLKVPSPILSTHASIAISLSFDAPPEGSHGQDEEADDFEVVVSKLPDGKEASRFAVSRQDAQSRSASLRLQAEAESTPSAHSSSTLVVVASGLTPSTWYICQARARTHVGCGEFSAGCELQTLPVPPEVVELEVGVTTHNSVALSWGIADRCASAAVMQACLGEETALAELQARSALGFRIRLCEGSSPRGWREVVGVRARPPPASPEGEAATGDSARRMFTLHGLAYSTHYRLQVAAVARGEGEGVWSNVVEFCTEPLAPTPSPPPAIDIATRDWAVLRWPAPMELTGGVRVQGYEVVISRAKGQRSPELYECSLDDCPGPPEDRSRVCVWHDGGEVKLSLGRLDPDTSYTVQVAAFTHRGSGVASSCGVHTRPVAPSISPMTGPRLVKSHFSKLVLMCDAPTPDWRDEDGSDVIGFRVRYYDCGAAGRVFSAPWREADVHFAYSADGKTIQFDVEGLSSDREYVVQVAAMTAFGRGAWSAESDHLHTWRLAPLMLMPQVLLRTHTTMVLGWSTDHPSKDVTDLGHDEDITEFSLTARSLPSGTGTPSAREDSSARIRRARAQELADLLHQDGVLRPEGQDVATSGSEALYGQDILCDGFSDRAMLEFVGVLRGLEPDQSYTCAVQAVTVAGTGHASPSSFPHSTLPIAPLIEDAQVDEVQHDRIQVSWKVPQLRTPLAHAAFEGLGLKQNVDELELKRIEVRCAAWTTWSRLGWREPVLIIEASQLQRDSDGRGYAVVRELDAERKYVVELRACSTRGAGLWCRVNGQGICTAVNTPAPLAPELVKNTARSLTFSFAGLEDRRIVAYEARRFELWHGGWRRASEPVRFNAGDPDVRVTSERRWVVTLRNLHSETTHALQLRGVTQSEGITKWSAWSEPMNTLREADAGSDAESSGYLATGQPQLPVQASGSAAQRSMSSDPEAIEDRARRLEAIVAFTVAYAIVGVQLPSVTVEPIADRASALLHKHRGFAHTAVDSIRQHEDDALWTTKLPDFLIHQAPLPGCSTLLLRELWKIARRCALVAHLFGHDVAQGEARALLLLCLLPPGNGEPLGGADDCEPDEQRMLYLVCRGIARETAAYAAANRGAVQGLSDLDVAGMLLRDYSRAGIGPLPGGDRLALEAGCSTPSMASQAAAAGLSEAAAEDAGPPSPTRVARALFRPARIEEHPVAVLCLFALWLLPLLVSASQWAAKRVIPMLVQNVQMDLSLAVIGVVMLILQIVGMVMVLWVQANLDRVIRFPSTLAFVIYAAAPGLSIWLATRTTLRSLAVAPCFALLGIYSFGTGYLRWADDLLDDNTLERRAVPRLVWGRRRQFFAVRAHRVLWGILVLDFVVEEVLGRWCGLHQFRPLEPALGPEGAEAATPPEFRSPAFGLFLAAATAHECVLGLTKRHTVLVRLLGARRGQLPYLRLFFMGVPSLYGQHVETIRFLTQVSLSKRWCCLVLFLRRWGAAGGILIPLSLHVLRHPGYLGALPKDTLVPIAVFCGCMMGISASSSFQALWAECAEHLEAEYRVLYLFPHMSPRARDRACDALALELERRCSGNLPASSSAFDAAVGVGGVALQIARGAIGIASSVAGLLLPKHPASIAAAPHVIDRSTSGSSVRKLSGQASDAARGGPSAAWGQGLRRRPSRSY